MQEELIKNDGHFYSTIAHRCLKVMAIDFAYGFVKYLF